MDQENQVPDTPSISLQDLVTLLNLIRVTAERGAIRAEEMSGLGALYEKLLNFLKHSGAIQTAEPPKEQNDNS